MADQRHDFTVPGRMMARTLILTLLALIAFAANSVLCRLALGQQAIDAAGFTILRLLSGAFVLFVLITIQNKRNSLSPKGSWAAGAMLFLYAISFSFAYVTLDTGTGALILFGSVQITMIVLSMLAGNRLHLSEWAGIAIAFAGFVYLVLPGVTAPPLTGFLLMTVAGISWGVYTLKGRASSAPLVDTAGNFLRTVPLVIVVAIVEFRHLHVSPAGAVLAVLSGGIASGLGYAIWYRALGGLGATQAAVVQLSVPVIAAIGGVMFMAEMITLRLTVAGLLILGGILLVVLGRYYFVPAPSSPKT